MNKVHKVVFCKATQTFQAVSEFAKGAGKNSTRSAKSTSRSFAKTAIALAVLAFSGQAMAEITIKQGVDKTSTANQWEKIEINGRKNYTDVVIGAPGTSVTQSPKGPIGGLAIGTKGKGAQALGGDAVAIGTDSQAETQSVAIGQATASGFGSVAIGNDDVDGVAMGDKFNPATGGPNGWKSKNIPLDKYNISQKAKDFKTTTGSYLVNSKENRWLRTTASGAAATALGIQAQATGDFAASFGGLSKATGFATTAFGTGAKAFADNSVAIGAGSTTYDDASGLDMTTAAGIAAKDPNTGRYEALETAKFKTAMAKYTPDAIVASLDKDGNIVGEMHYKAFAGGSEGMSEGDQVSFGSIGAERQLKNVAPGAINPWSTDAINGSQLAAIASELQTKMGENKNNPLTVIGNTNADSDGQEMVEVEVTKADGTKEKIKVPKYLGGDKDKEKTAYKAKDGTQRKLGEKLAIIGAGGTNVGEGNVTGITNLARNTDKPVAGDYSSKNITTVVSNGEVQIQMAKKPEFDQVKVGTPDPKTGVIAKPITIGPVDDNGTPKNRITGLDDNLPDTTTAPVAEQKPTQADLDKVKGNVATVNDILNSGINLKENGTAKDFVNPYDTLDFVNGDGTVVTVTPADDKKSNEIKVDVKVDEDTLAFEEVPDPKDPTKKIKKIKPKTATLTTNDGTDPKKPQGTVADLSDADKKKLVTAGSVADAINNAGFTITSSAVNAGVNAGKKDHFVKTGEKIELIAGNHMTINQANGKFTFETNNGAILTSSLMGDNETTVVVANIDGNPVIKDKTGKWVKADKDGKPTTEEVPADKIKDIKGTQVKAKTAKVEVDPATGKTKELKGADAEAVATAGDVQKAINDAYWSTKGLAGVDGGELVKEEARHNVKASHKVDFAPGKNMKLTQSVLKDNTTVYTYATKDDVEFNNITAKKGIKLGEGDTAVNMTPATTKTLDKDGNPTDKTPAVDMGGSTFTNVASNLPKTVSTNPDGTPAKDKATVKQEAPKAGDIVESNVATLGDVLNAGWNLSVGGNRPDGTETQEDVDFVKPYDQVEFVAGAGIVVDKETDGEKSIIKFRKADTDEIEPAKAGTDNTNDGSVVVTSSPNKGHGLISANNVARAINQSGWNLQENGVQRDLVNPGNKVNFINGAGTTVTVDTDKEGKKSDIKVDVNVDNKTTELEYQANGNKVVKEGDKFFATNSDGSKGAEITKPEELAKIKNVVKAKTTDFAITDGNGKDANGNTIPAGKVTPANADNLATAGDIANAINSSGWNIASGKAGTGVLVEEVDPELINPSEKVEFIAGDNIVLEQKTNKFTYSLNKDIKGLNSVVLGNNPNDPNTVSLTSNGINAGGNKISNVAPGTRPTDAVNVSQLRDGLNDVRDEAAGGVAGAAALGMIAQPNESGEAIIGAGVGYHRGQAALAVGMTATSDNNNWIIKGAVGVDTQKQATAGFSVNYKIW